MGTLGRAVGVPFGVGWAMGRGWRDSGTQVMPSAEPRAGGQRGRRNWGVVGGAGRVSAAWAVVC